MAKEGLAGVVTAGEKAVGETFETTSVLWRDGVPGFGGSKMEVVYGIKVHVFGVPRKGGLPHSEVEVGGVHTFDGDAIVLVYVVQNGA